jgi:general secretion pathway protein M
MTAQFMAWWRERSLREQRLLLVMYALLAVTILWLGLYRPIQGALSAARERHQQAVVTLGDARAQAEALRQVGKASRTTGPLAPIITQAANESGFANATVAPQGDRRVSISIPSARPAAVLAWIAALEARGIVVERLTARANSDPTLTVDATLAAAG